MDSGRCFAEEESDFSGEFFFSNFDHFHKIWCVIGSVQFLLLFSFRAFVNCYVTAVIFGKHLVILLLGVRASWIF